jgi:transcriptional regulator with XRE-family HTH domain
MNGNDISLIKEDSSSFKKCFAENLKIARIAAGLSQKKLAELMQVPAPTISRYENGLMEPTLRTAKALALILECDLNELAGLHLEYSNEDKAYLWNGMLQPFISVSYNSQSNNYEIVVEKEYNGYFLKPGNTVILHAKVFEKYNELLQNYLADKMSKYQKEVALQYFETILLHADEMAKQNNNKE